MEYDIFCLSLYACLLSVLCTVLQLCLSAAMPKNDKNKQKKQITQRCLVCVKRTCRKLIVNGLTLCDFYHCSF